MNILIKTALIASLTAPAAMASAQSSNILTVDVQRIYRECNACKTASTQLQTQAQQLQAYATQVGQPLQTEAEAIRTALAGKSPDAADAATRTRIQAFETKRQQADQQVQQRQQALQATQQNVLRQVNTKLGPIVTTVMTAHKATLVVDENSTLASAPTVDVTNEVMAQLNTQLPTISLTPPAAAAAPTGR